jgi:hypothetical protein
MRLLLIGCEYVGANTLGRAIHQWMKDVHKIDLGSVHAHWKVPNTILHYPDELSDQEYQSILALSKTILEANQRHNLYYHAPAAPADWDQMLIGHYIENQIYAELYYLWYGYGGVGQTDVRIIPHSKGLEDRILQYAPHTVLILLKAAPETIAKRMRTNPHKYPVVPEKDIQLVSRRFEEEYNKAKFTHRFTLDTSTATVEETLAEFIEKIQPHLTPTDLKRMASNKKA